MSSQAQAGAQGERPLHTCPSLSPTAAAKAARTGTVTLLRLGGSRQPGSGLYFLSAVSLTVPLKAKHQSTLEGLKECSCLTQFLLRGPWTLSSVLLI